MYVCVNGIANLRYGQDCGREREREKGLRWEKVEKENRKKKTQKFEKEKETKYPPAIPPHPTIPLP